MEKYQVLAWWVSWTNERGDHLPPGIKSFFCFKSASVDNMFTAFTRLAAVSATM